MTLNFIFFKFEQAGESLYAVLILFFIIILSLFFQPAGYSTHRIGISSYINITLILYFIRGSYENQITILGSSHNSVAISI